MAPFVIAVFAILAGIGCWLLLRSRYRLGLSPFNKQKSDPPPPAVEAPKQAPDFLIEMRRKDQSMKIESPKTEKPEFDLQEICRREKEIAGQCSSGS
jgi:hypothetical protein